MTTLQLVQVIILLSSATRGVVFLILLGNLSFLAQNSLSLRKSTHGQLASGAAIPVK